MEGLVNDQYLPADFAMSVGEKPGAGTVYKYFMFKLNSPAPSRGSSARFACPRSSARRS